MYQTHFDSHSLSLKKQATNEKRLAAYRVTVAGVMRERINDVPEYALAHATGGMVVANVRAAVARFKGVRRVIVVGIGGSSLGLEAVHGAVGEQKVALTVLDMISPAALTEIGESLRHIKKIEQLAVCVVSKSGATTETLANAAVLLRMLEDRFGAGVYGQTIFIGDPGTALVKTAKTLAATYIAMPKAVGGRYCVGTEAALVPLALLGHDIESFVRGLEAATTAGAEEAVAESAVRLFGYLEAGYRHYNFFAFEPRLRTLGAWYRQLAAESLGKEKTRGGQALKHGWIPTLSTPVELHSVGQLYLSGFPGVYTEFVSIDDNGVDYKVGPTKLAPHLKKFTLEEISTALYGGVVGAYQARSLPYRATVLSDELMYSLGYYMASAMLETMYLAELLDVDAFTQPHVELYKEKTRELLGL